MSRYLTLDLGTTYFKAALFDEAGKLLHLARRPLEIDHPHPGWWELPDERFEEHVTHVLGELRQQSERGFDGVRAVSFATQTNSIRLLDRHDRPLTPMILWLDERAAAYGRQVAAMNQPQRSGVPKLGGTFTPARLMYLAQNRAQYDQVARLCLMSDVLTLWFTGQHVTEAGAMGLSGMIDIHKLDWIEPFVQRSGLDRDCFATVTRAGTDLGAIRPEIAEQFRLPRDCRFVVGCLDQYAGAIGAGNVRPLGVSETTGTVLATVRCADSFDTHIRPDVFQGPGFDADVYFQMAFGTVSANLLEAYRNSLSDTPSFGELDRLAASVPPGAEGVHLADDHDMIDPATFFTSRPPSPGHAVRAILEAVAWTLREQVSQLCGHEQRYWPEEIRSVGGAARSELWRRIKAAILERRIVATTCPEPTSLGAAILAHHAVTGEPVPELAERWVEVRPPADPEPAACRAYLHQRRNTLQE